MQMTKVLGLAAVGAMLVLAVPIPPPGPCEANAVAAYDTATIVAIAIRETFMRNDVMTISPSKNN